MQLDRRLLMSASIGLGLSASVAKARERPPALPSHRASIAKSPDLGVLPDSGQDETQRLQAAIDKAAERGVALDLAAGAYVVRGLTLRSGSRLHGAAGATVLHHIGTLPAIAGSGLTGVDINGITIRGIGSAASQANGLIELDRVTNLRLSDIRAHRSATNGIALKACSGFITACRISQAAKAAISSVDAAGMEISHNVIEDCLNNGILVWRTTKGDDGTLVSMNRIERIGARDGGSGQNGNAINVFRAGGVVVSTNRIVDCAFSAVRANTASDVQIIANNVARIGEVALYVEFAFQGAVVSGNIVDGAATGISVTNFNNGGRLATVHGNVVRNLVQRAEDRERSGVGIAVEADAAVSGNVIEKAPTAGLTIGWGKYCRDVAATGNVIRGCAIGIAVSGDEAAGPVLVANNMISGATNGAIRSMDHGRPFGRDLAIGDQHANTDSSGRIRVTGNVVA